MAVRVLLAVLSAALVSWAAARLGALTDDGALAAAVVGAAVLAGGGLSWAAILMLFFVTGSALSRLPGAGRGLADKGATRDAIQVLANGGPAAVYAALSLFHPAELWTVGFTSAVAAATADTWATELGSRFGGMPLRITTGARLEPGTSGGVTPLGTGAAITGSALIALAATASRCLAPPVAAAVWACGLVGAVLDSLLGATVQERRFCPSCLTSTEQRLHNPCGSRTVRVAGWPGMTNDAVNAVATSAASVLCLGVLGVLWR